MQIAITAALGYDSYLVMRHGAGPGTSCEASNVTAATDKMSTMDPLGRQRLGCYFCNDVVAPVDVRFHVLEIIVRLLTCYFQQS